MTTAQHTQHSTHSATRVAFVWSRLRRALDKYEQARAHERYTLAVLAVLAFAFVACLACVVMAYTMRASFGAFGREASRAFVWVASSFVAFVFGLSVRDYKRARAVVRSWKRERNEARAEMESATN